MCASMDNAHTAVAGTPALKKHGTHGANLSLSTEIPIEQPGQIWGVPNSTQDSPPHGANREVVLDFMVVTPREKGKE